HTVATASCRPTTCCMAWTNSSASLPWVTRIRPIIEGLRSELPFRSGPAAKIGAGGTCPCSRFAALDKVGGARAEVAVQQCGRKSCLAQGRGHPFRDIDGAMPPAGAAEGRVDIGLALGLVAREREQQLVADPGEGLGKGRIVCDLFPHR